MGRETLVFRGELSETCFYNGQRGSICEFLPIVSVLCAAWRARFLSWASVTSSAEIYQAEELISWGNRTEIAAAELQLRRWPVWVASMFE